MAFRGAEGPVGGPRSDAVERFTLCAVVAASTVSGEGTLKEHFQ